MRDPLADLIPIAFLIAAMAAVLWMV